MDTRKRLHYISGLKGIACCFVMLGHFAGLVKYITAAEFDYSVFSFMSYPPLSVLFNESFWLYLFFLTSGFLLTLSRIHTLRELITKSLRRFLRLGVPILFSSAIVYVIYLCIGMRNTQTEALFVNTWYQSAYSRSATLVDVLLSPIQVLLLGQCPLNSVYWVLRDMFFASILIYLCLYAQEKLCRKSWAVYAVSYAYLILSFFISNTVFVCMIGMILAQHRHHVKQILSKNLWCGVAGLGICAFLAVLFPNVVTAVAFFSVAIWTIPFFPRMEKTTSGKIPLTLEKISFGIYSFHWPVVCSVGAAVLLSIWELGAVWAFVLCFVVSIAATVVLALVYAKTAERLAGVITEKITGAVTRCLTPTQKKH